MCTRDCITPRNLSNYATLKYAANKLSGIILPKFGPTWQTKSCLTESFFLPLYGLFVFLAAVTPVGTVQWIFKKLYLELFISFYVCDCFACMCTCIPCAGHLQLELSYKWLWATMWMLETKYGSFERSTSYWLWAIISLSKIYLMWKTQPFTKQVDNFHILYFTHSSRTMPLLGIFFPMIFSYLFSISFIHSSWFLSREMSTKYFTRKLWR